jgi:hypothetical protein
MPACDSRVSITLAAPEAVEPALRNDEGWKRYGTRVSGAVKEAQEVRPRLAEAQHAEAVDEDVAVSWSTASKLLSQSCPIVVWLGRTLRQAYAARAPACGQQV